MSTTPLGAESKSSPRVQLRKWFVPALAGLFVIFAAEREYRAVLQEY